MWCWYCVVLGLCGIEIVWYWGVCGVGIGLVWGVYTSCGDVRIVRGVYIYTTSYRSHQQGVVPGCDEGNHTKGLPE